MIIEKPNFIIIDDNRVDCFIAERIIQNSGKGESCMVFQQAAEALAYIQDQTRLSALTIVFLDIQMPIMNGFDFLNAFEYLPPEIKTFYRIYVLSSSINERDAARAKTFGSVKQFISKPVTHDTINHIVKNIAG